MVTNVIYCPRSKEAEMTLRKLHELVRAFPLPNFYEWLEFDGAIWLREEGCLAAYLRYAKDPSKPKKWYVRRLFITTDITAKHLRLLIDDMLEYMEAKRPR